MKPTIYLFTAACLLSNAISSQENSNLSLGYGTQGATMRFAYKISEFGNEPSPVYLFVEGGYTGHKFANPNFKFESTNYSSDSRILFGSIGIQTEFNSKSLSLSPFIGIRVVNARFKDRSLVKAIGERKIIRYWNNEQVGPEVENGYGNALNADGGIILGVKLSKRVNLFVLGAISPVKFSTSSTLFGEFWGESPYPNDYHIDLDFWRAGGGVRINF